MSNIKGIIFDLDGVIVFTDQYHYQAWKKLAVGIGPAAAYEMTDKAIRSFADLKELFP